MNEKIKETSRKDPSLAALEIRQQGRIKELQQKYPIKSVGLSSGFIRGVEALPASLHQQVDGSID